MAISSVVMHSQGMAIVFMLGVWINRNYFQTNCTWWNEWPFIVFKLFEQTDKYIQRQPPQFKGINGLYKCKYERHPTGKSNWQTAQCLTNFVNHHLMSTIIWWIYVLVSGKTKYHNIWIIFRGKTSDPPHSIKQSSYVTNGASVCLMHVETN